uniref:Fibronectin type III domain protein n=1 Tax=Geobacter sp. (strain M21) TaxID=443144 RepID=C6DYR7_GEOSM
MKNPFGGGSDEEVIRLAGDFLTKDAVLESIFTVLPNLQKLKSAHGRHLGLFNEVLGGNHEKEGELQAVRQEVSAQLGLLRGMALLAGTQDPTIPQKLGLQQQQPLTKRTLGNLTSPENFRMVYDGHTIVARANAVKGAKSFEVWGCDGDPMTESNWRHLTTSARVNRIEILGLTPGKLYYFRIRAISSSGTGPWSNFISMMTI